MRDELISGMSGFGREFSTPAYGVLRERHRKTVSYSLTSEPPLEVGQIEIPVHKKCVSGQRATIRCRGEFIRLRLRPGQFSSCKTKTGRIRFVTLKHVLSPDTLAASLFVHSSQG